ncbi:MAG: hydantoinase B/oxoprolinase family protein [Thermoplasmata archaeon]
MTARPRRRPRPASSPEPDRDPFTLEVLRGLLQSVPREMGVTLKRTSFHPIFNEINDFSCAIVDPEGEMVAQSVSNPPQLGTMESSVRAALDEIGAENLAPGDVVIHNDPFRGGNHLPDVTILLPVFHDDELFLIPANRGHHGDIGGARPGSFAGDSTTIFQEGVRIPPLKLYERGHPNRAVLELLLANVRTPHYMRGDLRAQVAACETGRTRILEIVRRYGAAAVRASCRYAKDHSEALLRAEIAQWPPGTYEFEDFLDSDGIDLDRPVKIHARVTVRGSDLYFDYTGSDLEVRGPLNATFGVLCSATYNSVLCLSDYRIPTNHGCYRPIHVTAPEGTVVHARFPAAVVGGNTETNHRITDAVWAALAIALRDRVPAADMGTTFNVSAGGVDPRSGRYYVWYLTPPGGMGARPTKDGMGAVVGAKLGGFPAHISLEVFETHFPWVSYEYSLAPDSGGPGEFRGGLAVRWRIGPVGAPAELTVNTDRIFLSPYGLFGGYPGLYGRVVVATDARSEEGPEIGKGSFSIPAGGTLFLRTPGGGGYGSPLRREPAAVVRDVKNEVVSPERAREDYGVVLHDGAAGYDADGTRQLRAQLANERRRDDVFLDQGQPIYTRTRFRVVPMADAPAPTTGLAAPRRRSVR